MFFVICSKLSGRRSVLHSLHLKFRVALDILYYHSLKFLSSYEYRAASTILQCPIYCCLLLGDDWRISCFPDNNIITYVFWLFFVFTYLLVSNIRITFALGGLKILWNAYILFCSVFVYFYVAISIYLSILLVNFKKSL